MTFGLGAGHWHSVVSRRREAGDADPTGGAAHLRVCRRHAARGMLGSGHWTADRAVDEWSGRNVAVLVRAKYVAATRSPIEPTATAEHPTDGRAADRDDRVRR